MRGSYMEKHITTVAILHIGLSVFGAVLGIFLMILLTSIGVISNDYEARNILWLIGSALGTFLIIISIPGIIGGIALLRYKDWGRILILILSAIDLMNIPLGTALGIYSIWVLVQPEAVALFNK
jgi:hypothetical protein